MHVFSDAEAGRFIESVTVKSAAPSRIPFVSNASVKANRKLIIEIGLEKSDIWDLICI